MDKKDLLLGLLLITIGVLTRTIFHFGANIEFVTISGVVAGYYFKNKAQAMAVPILIMALSDIIIGNTNIMLFTWSGFLLAPLLGALLRHPRLEKYKSSSLFKLVGFGGASLASVLFFFLWTNLGVVLLGSMYPHSISGVFESYINALPFLRNQVYGNLVFVGVFTVFMALGERVVHKYSLQKLQ